MMAPDIPLRRVVDLDQTIFLPVGSVTCPFLSGHIFVHFVLKGTFLHGIIAKKKFCVPLVPNLPPLPLSSSNIVIRGDLNKGRIAFDSDKSLRRFYFLVFLSSYEEDPCAGHIVQHIFYFITSLDSSLHVEFTKEVMTTLDPFSSSMSILSKGSLLKMVTMC